MTSPNPTDNAKSGKVLDDEPTPMLDDDVELGGGEEADRQPPAAAENPEGEAIKPQPRGEHPTRLSIVEAARAKRDEEEGKAHQEEPDEPQGAPPIAAKPAEKQEKKAPETGPSDSEFLNIVVDGEPMRVKRSDYEIHGASDEVIIRIAQKDQATNKRLRDANRLLDSARTQRQENPADQSGDTDGIAAPQVRPDRISPPLQTTEFDDEKLGEIAERIQIGDAEQGKEALRELVRLAATSPAQMNAAVEQTLNQRDHQSEITKAVERFGHENPDIVSDPDLEEVALNMTARVLRDDMKKIGITDEQLASLGNDKRALAMAHRTLRLQGQPIPSYDDVLGRVSGEMRSKFGIARPAAGDGSPPKPAGVPEGQVQQRISRKEHAQPQPRHGGARAGAPQEPKPKTPIDHIREMRIKRGFRNLPAS